MVKGLISRLDLVTCAVKHSSVLTSPHWNTRCRTRNPLHCVPLPHPTVTGPRVPLYRTCTYNILQPHTLTQPQEDPVHMSQAFPMSSYDLRKKKPSLVLLVECQKSGCGVGAGLVPGCWCWAGAWVTVSQMETKKRNICAVSGPRPPLTRVKIFSVHPVKIFSVHCVRPAAMCLVQNMCNNLAHVTTISKHSAQKTAYIEPQQHTHIAWFDIHIHSTHTIKSTDVRCYHFHLSRSLIILVRYKKLEKTWTSVFCIHYFDYV